MRGEDLVGVHERLAGTELGVVAIHAGDGVPLPADGVMVGRIRIHGKAASGPQAAAGRSSRSRARDQPLS